MSARAESFRKCIECGMLFRTVDPTVSLCGSCEKSRLEQAKKSVRRYQRRTSYGVIPLTAFVRKLENYNAKHKTCYSYGQALVALAAGIINPKEFDNC